MEIPSCYDNSEVVQPFLTKAKEAIPLLPYLAIHDAYVEQDQMFKVVALSHLKNYFKKAAFTKEVFNELICLLDTFTDPYQDFLEKRNFSTWAKTKTNILGGII